MTTQKVKNESLIVKKLELQVKSADKRIKALHEKINAEKAFKETLSKSIKEIQGAQ